jgi:hypothetical protein
MNDNENMINAEAETQPRTNSRVTYLILTIGAVAVLVAAGLLFTTQVNSEPGCAGDAPCMLYFYIDD